MENPPNPFVNPDTNESIFGENPPTTEGWKMPSLEERRKALRDAALAAFDGNDTGELPRLIALGSEYGFRDSYPDQTDVNPHGIRAALEIAANEAEAGFKGVEAGDAAGFERGQTTVPEELNARFAGRMVELVYPTEHERDGSDYKALPNERVAKVQEFIKEKINLATIAEVTAHQLGMPVPEGFTPEKAYGAIVASKGEGEYGLKDLEEFMNKGGEAMTEEKDILVTDLLLRLANATWAGGQVAVAKLKNARGRLERSTFDTPEGRQRQMYDDAEKEFGAEAAFYIAVFENAKDYLNLNPSLKKR